MILIGIQISLQKINRVFNMIIKMGRVTCKDNWKNSSRPLFKIGKFVPSTALEYFTLH